MLELAPTPLIPMHLQADSPPILCKCEFMNPSGSTKDRIATFILTKAWREGVVRRGDLVAEVSSGSTSIAMAMVCAHLGLKFIAIMPEGVSIDSQIQTVAIHDFCLAHGFRYSPRLHVLIFGNQRGV